MPHQPDAHAFVRFIFELGGLRQEARQGWLRIRENPENVAEHTQRAACLGYLLAHLERFKSPDRVATMILFHDMHEVRTGDADLVQRRYVQLDESAAALQQTQGLGDAGTHIFRMWKQVDEQSTQAGKIAKDAEILEMAFTARELVVRGNRDAQAWIKSSAKRMKTKWGRKLLKIVNKSDPGEWWKGIWGITPVACRRRPRRSAGRSARTSMPGDLNDVA
jgi:putative hydrolase of HD superfamily